MLTSDVQRQLAGQPAPKATEECAMRMSDLRCHCGFYCGGCRRYLVVLGTQLVAG